MRANMQTENKQNMIDSQHMFGEKKFLHVLLNSDEIWQCFKINTNGAT